MPDQTIASQSAEICGEVGTSFTTDHEPHYTDPCRLPADHDELHDWAQREAAGEPSPAELATAEGRAQINRLLNGTGHELDVDDDTPLSDAVTAVLAAFEEQRQLVTQAVGAKSCDALCRDAQVDATAYRDLADALQATMTDPDRWDGDEAEIAIMLRYVKHLAGERDQKRRQLDTMREVARTNQRHVATLGEILDRIEQAVTRWSNKPGDLDYDCRTQILSILHSGGTASVPGSSRRAQETERQVGCGPACSEGHTYEAGCEQLRAAPAPMDRSEA